MRMFRFPGGFRRETVHAEIEQRIHPGDRESGHVQIVKRGPADFTAVAVFLRPHIRRVKRIDPGLEKAHALGLFGVLIGFARPESEPLRLIHLFRQEKLEAETREERHFPLRLAVDLERETAVRQEGVKMIAEDPGLQHGRRHPGDHAHRFPVRIGFHRFHPVLQLMITCLDPTGHIASVPAVVIVGRSAEQIETRTAFQQRQAVNRPVGDQPGSLADGDQRFIRAGINGLGIFIHHDRSGMGFDRVFDHWSLDGQRELRPGDLMPGTRPVGIASEQERQIQEIFRARFRIFRERVRNFHIRTAARLDGQRGHGTALHGLAVFADAPGDVEMFQREEIVMVGYRDDALFQILGGEPDRRIDFFRLDHAGGRRLIGENQSVGDEISVVGFVAEITAVSEIFMAVFVLCADAVVAEFPDESALHFLVGEEDLPVVLQSAGAVAHRVGVFAQNEWFFAFAEFPGEVRTAFAERAVLEFDAV